jgi:hypothetical protein
MASHRTFGLGALNWRLTRSSGHGAALSLIVVQAWIVPQGVV